MPAASPSATSNGCRIRKVDEVNARLQKIMTRAFHEMVDTMRKHHVPPRAGAMILAVGRVSEATLVRGLFP